MPYVAKLTHEQRAERREQMVLDFQGGMTVDAIVWKYDVSKAMVSGVLRYAGIIITTVNPTRRRRNNRKNWLPFRACPRVSKLR